MFSGPLAVPIYLDVLPRPSYTPLGSQLPHFSNREYWICFLTLNTPSPDPQSNKLSETPKTSRFLNPLPFSYKTPRPHEKQERTQAIEIWLGPHLLVYFLYRYYFLFKTHTRGICKKGGREVTGTAAPCPGAQAPSARPALHSFSAFRESALAIRAAHSSTYSDHSCSSPDHIASGVLA